MVDWALIKVIFGENTVKTPIEGDFFAKTKPLKPQMTFIGPSSDVRASPDANELPCALGWGLVAALATLHHQNLEKVTFRH